MSKTMSAADLASAAALASAVTGIDWASTAGLDLAIFTCSLGDGESFALKAFCSAVTFEN